MKSIEERAWEKYPEVIKHHNLAYIDINEEKRKMYIEIATQQKAIDDVILLKLKSAWEKQAQINHDDELNYQQGYHDAIEKACEWLEKELQEIASDEVKKNFLENNFNIILKSQVPGWLINFHKAIEEQI